MKKRICIFPGTFDPFTNGHLDIIKRANTIFDEIIIAIGINERKTPTFDLKTRIKMIELSTKEFPNIKIEGYKGLLVNFATKKDANFIIRGIRSSTDFEYEVQINHANSSINSNIETIFLIPNLKNLFISSSIIKSIYLNESSQFSHLVPKPVFEIMQTYKKDEY